MAESVLYKPDQYDDAYACDPGVLHFLSTVLSHLPPQSQVLDVGCGTGKPVAETLAAAGHFITGIDNVHAMVELSQQRIPNGVFQLSDMRQYVHPTGKQLDAVLMVRSLFRLGREEIEETVRKYGSQLHGGGLICIATMAADDFSPDNILSGYDPDGLCAREVRKRFMGNQVTSALFTRAGWKQLLQKNGFAIVNQKMDVFGPPDRIDSDALPYYYIIAEKI
ncbi:S-adenosyl-L-methionine-dependent methyltransferase [Aspergillus steynii IBT 23096]|uniref:phosphoethanolamine N-methyltransferase n=1 Tax=Aspergillus steynii IBT 23096 TaxID=1392250 RepID=A0A2I2FUW6_9EURO|nr:S-adenosyl-L-methionine-dependent methyltransferase [Aspergillus steynii IBT 23096]PLB44414.1 S-adenosyl-L-methionine-dependent methyltransferase [Aspergillus steynii IBT 23096]